MQPTFDTLYDAAGGEVDVAGRKLQEDGEARWPKESTAHNSRPFDICGAAGKERRSGHGRAVISC